MKKQRFLTEDIWVNKAPSFRKHIVIYLKADVVVKVENSGSITRV